MSKYPKHRNIVLACLLFQAGGVGILLNSTGLFMTGMTQAGLFSAKEVSLYFTLRTIASALTVTFLTQWFYKNGVRKHMSMIALFMALGYVLLAQSHHLWMFYVSAILVGVTTSTIIIPMPIIMSHWFVEKKGLMLGIVFSASGIISALYNMLLSPILSQWGWQIAIYVSVVLAILLMLPSASRWIYLTPEERGTQAYGTSVLQAGHNDEEDYESEVKLSKFILVALAISFCGTLSALVNYIPMYSLSKGFDLPMASTLSSLCMVGNVLGKLVLGYFFDQLGAFKTTLLTLSILILALFFMMSDVAVLIMLGSLLFGLNFGLYLLMPPLLVMRAFKASWYKKMIGRMTAMASGLIALYTFSIGYLYEYFGHYDIVLLMSVVFCVISLSAISLLYKVHLQTN